MLPLIDRNTTEDEEMSFADDFKRYFIKPGQPVTIPSSYETEQTFLAWYQRMTHATSGSRTSRDYFDGYVDDNSPLSQMFIGLQIKQKKRSSLDFSAICGGTGQSIMELTNAEAFLWKGLEENGLERGHFHEKKRAKKIGDILLVLLAHQRDIAPEQRSAIRHNGGRQKKLDLRKSAFINLAWKPCEDDKRRFECMLISFNLTYPEPGELVWKYEGRSLVGQDRAENKIIRWSGESGGQVQFRPLIQSRRHKSKVIPIVLN